VPAAAVIHHLRGVTPVTEGKASAGGAVSAGSNPRGTLGELPELGNGRRTRYSTANGEMC